MEKPPFTLRESGLLKEESCADVSDMYDQQVSSILYTGTGDMQQWIRLAGGQADGIEKSESPEIGRLSMRPRARFRWE